MNTKLTITLFLLLTTCIVAFSQSSWNEWRNGAIFLSSGEKLSGKIIYEDDIEVVQYLSEQKGVVSSFGAFLVDSFYFYSGNNKKSYHRYYWNKNQDHFNETPLFFQTFYKGDYRILARETKVTVMDDWDGTDLLTPTLTFPNAMYPSYSERIAYNFFYLNEGKISYITDLKKFLISKYPNKKKKIKYALRSYSQSNMQQIVGNLIVELESDY